MKLRDVTEYRQKPALVIGGAPSVLRDLPRLFAEGFMPACVLAANEHGTHQSWYPVTYSVTLGVTHFFRKVSMNDLLRNLGYPVIAPYDWADLTLDTQGVRESGLLAIIAATVLRCDPILVTGLDGYKSGQRYFHGDQQHERYGLTWDEQPLPLLQSEFNSLINAVKGFNVHPVSGYLTRLFPAYERSAA